MKIKHITLTDYRGLPGTFDLSCVDRSGRPQTLLITGDNGVGKSSIVSAVELACQEQISRHHPINATDAPQVINLSTDADRAVVVVTLSDGTQLHRTVKRITRNRHTMSGSAVPSEFGLAPISLQRADIVKFLMTTPRQRGELFIDHFKLRPQANLRLSTDGEDRGEEGAPADVTDPHDANDVSVDDATNKFQSLKAERRILLADLARRAGLSLQPQSQRDINHAVSLAFYGGQTKAELERGNRKFPNEASRFQRRLDELNREISSLKRTLQAIKPRSSGKYALAVKRLAVLLGDVSDPLSRAFTHIIGDPWVKQVDVEFGRTGELSIDLSIRTVSGLTVDPQSIFSEGKQDLLALLFFLEVARAATRRGQAKVLILDDVLQSVDSTVRVKLIDWLLQDFADWQFLLTVHDRAWRAQLVELLHKNGHGFVEKEIRGWTFNDGPRLLDDTSETRALSTALETGTPHSVAVEAGRLLERIADRLSWTLPVAVQRVRGDKYDLGALWPPVRKKLVKTSLRTQSDEIDRNLVLRNMLGAHFNEWADAIPASDADSFGNAVLALYAATKCSVCEQWLVPNRNGPPWICPCGRTDVSAAPA